VRHVIFIEEAHNIIAPTTEQTSSDSVDPKISATNYIMKMLAEVRALREAIVIADQLPTALASQVTKNTGLKLVHRLTAQDDREQIGSAISATPLQLERMASFTNGRAYIYHERTMKPFEMQVAEWIPPNVRIDTSNDDQLFQKLWNNPVSVDAIMVAIRNWQLKYIEPLDKKTDTLLEWLEDATDNKEKKLYLNDLKSIRIKLETLKVRCQRMKKLWLRHCEENHKLCDEYEAAMEYIDEIMERSCY
jgi:hypothetical protein